MRSTELVNLKYLPIQDGRKTATIACRCGAPAMNLDRDHTFQSLAEVPCLTYHWRTTEQTELFDRFGAEVASEISATAPEDVDALIGAVEAALRKPGRLEDYVRLLVNQALRLRWANNFDAWAAAEELLLLAQEIAEPEDLHGVISVLASMYDAEGFVPELAACRETRVRLGVTMHTADARLLPERLDRLRQQPAIAWPAPVEPTHVQRDTLGARLIGTNGVDGWLRLEKDEGLRAAWKTWTP